MTTTNNTNDQGFTHEQRTFLCEVANKLGGSSKIQEWDENADAIIPGAWLNISIELPNTLGLSISWSESKGFVGTYSGTSTCELAALKNGDTAYGPNWSDVRGWQSFNEACTAILELLVARPDEFGFSSNRRERYEEDS